ncbi:MAG: hypothetical protein J5I98_18055 [Phaeodactylibacter sp.]|nr:hypothetical protein [Phaeodactylibacter sp.]
MAKQGNTSTTIHFDQPLAYQIRLRGHLGPQWAGWFEGMAITLEENGDTVLTGPVADQAALHGLLRKVRDLGLPLLLVACVEEVG